MGQQWNNVGLTPCVYWQLLKNTIEVWTPSIENHKTCCIFFLQFGLEVHKNTQICLQPFYHSRDEVGNGRLWCHAGRLFDQPLSAFWFPEKLTKRFLSNSHKHHLGVCMCLFGAMTFDLHFLIVSQTLRLYCPKKMKFKVFKTTNTCTIICLLRLHKYGSIKLLKEDNVMIKWGPTGVNQDCDLSKKSEVLSLPSCVGSLPPTQNVFAQLCIHRLSQWQIYSISFQP